MVPPERQLLTVPGRRERIPHCCPPARIGSLRRKLSTVSDSDCYRIGSQRIKTFTSVKVYNSAGKSTFMLVIAMIVLGFILYAIVTGDGQ